MNEQLVSIIIPCFNQAQYLEECLKSVLEQRYHNWECLIINDGSTDNTELIAMQWTKKDSRFSYFNKNNGGLCSARNYGIEKAKGQYILPLDSDDKIGPDYIKFGMSVFRKDSSIGVVYCNVRLFGAINKKWVLPPFDKQYLLCENLLFCSCLFRKKDWINVGGYDINMKYGWEDWEFWINMFYTNDLKSYKLNYEGFYYRKKDSSMLVDLIGNELKKRMMYDYIYQKHKGLYDMYFVHPIIGFGKLWRLKNKNKMLFHFIQKMKILYNR